MQDTNELNILDIDMSVVAKYVSDKYVLSAYADSEDTLYIPFGTGRVIITYEELREFLNNNQDHYVESGWVWTDLIDTYIVHCLINTIDGLMNTIYPNSIKTILQ